MRGESTTLPLGWERVDDADDGVFYFQQSTGTSSWTRPENAALGASAASPKQPSQPALPSTASSQVPPVAAAKGVVPADVFKELSMVSDICFGIVLFLCCNVPRSFVNLGPILFFTWY